MYWYIPLSPRVVPELCRVFHISSFESSVSTWGALGVSDRPAAQPLRIWRTWRRTLFWSSASQLPRHRDRWTSLDTPRDPWASVSWGHLGTHRGCRRLRRGALHTFREQETMRRRRGDCGKGCGYEYAKTHKPAEVFWFLPGPTDSVSNFQVRWFS